LTVGKKETLTSGAPSTSQERRELTIEREARCEKGKGGSPSLVLKKKKNEKERHGGNSTKTSLREKGGTATISFLREVEKSLQAQKRKKKKSTWNYGKIAFLISFLFFFFFVVFFCWWSPSIIVAKKWSQASFPQSYKGGASKKGNWGLGLTLIKDALLSLKGRECHSKERLKKKGGNIGASFFQYQRGKRSAILPYERRAKSLKK